MCTLSFAAAGASAADAALVAGYLRSLTAAGRFPLTAKLVAGKAKQTLQDLLDRLEDATDGTDGEDELGAGDRL